MRWDVDTNPIVVLHAISHNWWTAKYTYLHRQVYQTISKDNKTENIILSSLSLSI